MSCDLNIRVLPFILQAFKRGQVRSNKLILAFKSFLEDIKAIKAHWLIKADFLEHY